MDAGFGAMHDDVAAGDAAPVLGAATAVTAEPAAGAAAAVGEADAPLAAVAQLAAYQVLLEDAVLAGSFEEGAIAGEVAAVLRSEAHTSELPSLMRISYAALCCTKNTNIHAIHYFTA